MFGYDYAFAQVFAFILISFIQLCIIVAVMPFEEKRMNFIEILNESTILLTSYLLLPLIDP